MEWVDNRLFIFCLWCFAGTVQGKVGVSVVSSLDSYCSYRNNSVRVNPPIVEDSHKITHPPHPQSLITIPVPNTPTSRGSDRSYDAPLRLHVDPFGPHNLQ